MLCGCLALCTTIAASRLEADFARAQRNARASANESARREEDLRLDDASLINDHMEDSRLFLHGAIPRFCVTGYKNVLVAFPLYNTLSPTLSPWRIRRPKSAP